MKPEELEKSPDLSSIESRIFSQQGESILIGGVKLPNEIRDILREQAKYLDSSQLWEILNASIADESVNLALIQSTNFDHVQFAKALWHYSSFMKKIVLLLSK